MSESIGNKQVSGLLEYLDSLVSKGRVRSSAATPLKSAVKAVFSMVEKDGWENTNVENIDLDDYMERFKNLTLGDYDAKSYITYRARVNRALNWYKNFLENPGWTPSVKQSTAAKKSKSNTAKPYNAAVDAEEGEVVSVLLKPELPATNASTDTNAKVIDFPFPMSDGSIATLRLPRALSSRDAQRLKSFISTLVLDGEETDA